MALLLSGSQGTTPGRTWRSLGVVGFTTVGRAWVTSQWLQNVNDSSVHWWTGGQFCAVFERWEPWLKPKRLACGISFISFFICTCLSFSSCFSVGCTSVAPSLSMYLCIQTALTPSHVSAMASVGSRPGRRVLLHRLASSGL